MEEQNTHLHTHGVDFIPASVSDLNRFNFHSDLVAVLDWDILLGVLEKVGLSCIVLFVFFKFKSSWSSCAIHDASANTPRCVRAETQSPPSGHGYK